LALDIREEFRPVIADRLVLFLYKPAAAYQEGFTKGANGTVTMDDITRKTVLEAYQKRKQDEVLHQYINESVPVGLLFFIQATVSYFVDNHLKTNRVLKLDQLIVSK
jgi:CRISPR-associated protein Cas1